MDPGSADPGSTLVLDTASKLIGTWWMPETIHKRLSRSVRKYALCRCMRVYSGQPSAHMEEGKRP